MDSHRDFLVGLFMLASAGFLIGLLVVTSNVIKEEQDLYVRAATANGLSEDARVFLQGLQVGRVAQIHPIVDVEGSLSFVAHLSIQESYPDGTPFLLPRGTVAAIEQPTPITAAVVRLDLPAPDQRLGGVLLPGDTIDLVRPPGVIDMLGDLAGGLKDEVMATLEQTRILMEQSSGTIAAAEGMLSETQRTLSTTTPRMHEALDQLAASLARTDTLLGNLTPRVGPLADSLLVTLAQARETLGQFGSLAVSADSLLTQNQTLVNEALQNLTQATITLDHFSAEISRRPTRLLTGVEPPPRNRRP